MAEYWHPSTTPSLQDGPSVTTKLRNAPAASPVLDPRRGDALLRPAALAKVWTGRDAPFETMAVPGVLLGPGDAIVAVELATVCGNDVRIVAGARPAPAPLVLGHEYVGRIVALSPSGAHDASGSALRLGDRVVAGSVVDPAGPGSGSPEDDSDAGVPAADGPSRRVRHYGAERIGAHWELSGAFATHVHVRRGTAIVPVGERIPARVAAPAAGGAAVAWAALRHAEQSTRLAQAVVQIDGAGLVGLTATSMAADRGARVVVSEPDRRRRVLARRFGAVAAYDPCDRAAREKALRKAGATVVDVVLDGVGDDGAHDASGADLRAAIDYLRGAWGRRPFEDLVDPVLPLDAVDEALRLSGPGGPVRVGIDPRR